MKLTCMRGYAASGKSTKALEIATQTGAVIVCRDNLRKMMLGSYWTGKRQDEDRVTIGEEAQVKALLGAGVPTIVDATHLNPSYLRRWAKLATRQGVEFEVVDLKIHEEVCCDRDADRYVHGERYVGEKVIKEQAKRWPIEKWPTITAEPFVIEPVEWDNTLPDAIIVDIDGTLAHSTGRSPYDYTRVDEDDVDRIISGLVWAYRTQRFGQGAFVFIVSGRDDSCYVNTIEWLDRHNVPYDRVLMRPTGAVDERGNKLPDYQVKYDIFNEHIRGKYNVCFVLDDRLQVCRMWHRLGLKLLRVGDPDADF